MPLDADFARAYTVTMPARNLRRLRTLCGMRQQDLAESAGLTRLTISNLERMVHQPGPRTLKRLADALGCSIADLVGE
jgi:transcriptional regulator with XRE-family HTH domain